MANGIYPARPSSWLYIVALLTVLSLCGKDPSWGIISRLEVYLRESREYVPPYDRITASLLFSVMLWLAGIAAIKYFLLFMLRYKGWMYEPHGRMSITSKVWLVSVNHNQWSSRWLFLDDSLNLWSKSFLCLISLTVNLERMFKEY